MLSECCLGSVGFTVREGVMKPLQYLPIDMDHPLNSTDPYGVRKMLSEEIGGSFAQRWKMSVVALRPMIITYPEMHGELEALAESPDTYAGTPTGGRPCWHLVDPRDVAAAFVKAMEFENVIFERFLISANMTLSPTPKLDGLKNILCHLPPIRNPELYENNPFAPLFDREHTQKWLVFEPKYDAGSIVNL